MSWQAPKGRAKAERKATSPEQAEAEREILAALPDVVRSLVRLATPAVEVDGRVTIAACRVLLDHGLALEPPRAEGDLVEQVARLQAMPDAEAAATLRRMAALLDARAKGASVHRLGAHRTSNPMRGANGAMVPGASNATGNAKGAASGAESEGEP